MAASYSVWLCVFLSSSSLIFGRPLKEQGALALSETDDELNSRDVINDHGRRFKEPVKKSFHYGTGYGHYHHPDEDLETSQYLSDLEQFYLHWFGG